MIKTPLQWRADVWAWLAMCVCYRNVSPSPSSLPPTLIVRWANIQGNIGHVWGDNVGLFYNIGTKLGMVDKLTRGAWGGRNRKKKTKKTQYRRSINYYALKTQIHPTMARTQHGDSLRCFIYVQNSMVLKSTPFLLDFAPILWWNAPSLPFPIYGVMF